MTEITRELLDKVVLDLAQTRAFYEPLIAELTTKKNEIESNLKRMMESLKYAEDTVRNLAMEYVQQTGDLEPHPSLTFRRTTKLMYDKQDVTNTLIVETLPQVLGFDVEKAEAVYEAIEVMLGTPKLGKYLNVSVTLDVRAFEAAYKAGELAWAQVEQVAAPTIAINKLGDILIKKELEYGTNQI